MNNVFMIHRLFGGMILPGLLLLAALWFTAAWQPGRWPDRPARLLHALVDIQFLLGLTFWSYMVFVAGAGAKYLAFPFLLHPLLGLLAAAVAKYALRPGGRAARLGRWSPLASFGLLLVLVLAAGRVAELV